MKINHSAVTSSVYKLVKTIEVDIQLGDDSWTTRIELLRNTEKKNRFRCHVWEFESFRLTPTFPMNEKGQPSHVSDDLIMVERGIARSDIATRTHESFVASSIDAALDMIIDDLKRFLEHATLEKAD